MKRLFHFVAAILFFSFNALAAPDAGAPPPEKVAVLPFSGEATRGDIDAARTATMGALISRGEPLATESELVTAETAAQGAPNDTKAQYVAAGRASSAKWVVVGHVK